MILKKQIESNEGLECRAYLPNRKSVRNFVLNQDMYIGGDILKYQREASELFNKDPIFKREINRIINQPKIREAIAGLEYILRSETSLFFNEEIVREIKNKTYFGLSHEIARVLYLVRKGVHIEGDEALEEFHSYAKEGDYKKVAIQAGLRYLALQREGWKTLLATFGTFDEF